MASSADAVPASASGERLVDQAYRQIRDAIVATRLAPGAPLDEKALSSSLGLGLTPIRDALKRLTLEKLAVTYPRRGTYVSAINIADEARLTEVRVELEGLAAALAAERATDDERAVLLQLLEDLEGGSHERAAHTELDARTASPAEATPTTSVRPKEALGRLTGSAGARRRRSRTGRRCGTRAPPGRRGRGACRRRSRSGRP